MSKETDLDWLIRVTAGVIEPWCEFIARSGIDSWACTRVFDLERDWFTRAQYLTRRAELQNKPSFSDHSDAKCFFQHANGVWSKNIESHGMGIDAIGWRNKYQSLRADYDWLDVGKGEVLGDWRDTLEKRPEQDEFETFTSIEDNQEQDMAQQQEMKQDNRWHERGELPPVGVECEVRIGNDWRRTKVVAALDTDVGKLPIFTTPWCPQRYVDCGPEQFRPIRSERELAIDEMMKVAATNWGNLEDCCEALYRAGYRKEAK